MIHLAIILLAAVAFDQNAKDEPDRNMVTQRALMLSIALAVIAVLATSRGYTAEMMSGELFASGAPIVVVMIAIMGLGSGRRANVAYCAILIVTFVSAMAYHNHEKATFEFFDYEDYLGRLYRPEGADLYSLSDRRESWLERPARLVADSAIGSNIAYYRQDFSYLGYDGRSLKRVLGLHKRLADPDRADVYEFYTTRSRSLLIDQSAALKLEKRISSCNVGECDFADGSATMLEFRRVGATYSVELNTPSLLVENEIYFPGWTAEPCDDAKQCTTLAAEEVDF